MNHLLLVATGVVVLASMWRAYAVSRDPVHPMLFLGPMILFVYVFRPWRLLGSPNTLDLLAGEDGLAFVLLVNMINIGAFCVGLNWTLKVGSEYDPVSLRVDLPESKRSDVRRLATVMGLIGAAAFLYMVEDSGGLVRVYSRVKGGAGAASGYLGEAPLLAFPAILLYMISKVGERWRVADIVLILVFASPHLVHGILGTRRGPLFLVLATIGVGWFLTSKRRRSLVTLLLLVTAIGGLVILMYSQRRMFYLHSQESLSAQSFGRVALAEGADQGDMFFYGGGSILTADHTGRHGWGTRMLATMLIRPIPKQIWPTKYEDTARYLDAAGPGVEQGRSDDWMEAVGWYPVPGSSSGFAASFFAEFAWFGVVASWLFARLWAWFWVRAKTHIGIHSVLFVLLLALGIYVPTQSPSAVLHRFLFIGVLLWLLWRMVLRDSVLGQRARAASG